MHEIGKAPVDLAAAGPPEFWWALLKSGAMLCLVLALLILVLYLIKRFWGYRFSTLPKGDINVVATHYLSPKCRVVLLDVLGQRYLLGVTPERIDYLAEIPSEQRSLPGKTP